MSLTVSNKVFADPGACQTILSFLDVNEVERSSKVSHAFKTNAEALQKKALQKQIAPALKAYCVARREVVAFRKVFANQRPREGALSFLSQKELDQAKSVRRSWNPNIQALQRRVILRLFSNASENLPIGREILERAPIVNGGYPQYQSFSSSVVLGINSRSELPYIYPAIYFKVECRAEGKWCGSKVVKKTVGSVFLVQGVYSIHVGVPSRGLSELREGEPRIIDRLLQGESIDYNNTKQPWLLDFQKFEEDRPSGWFCCLSRLIRRCFFSKDKFKIALGK